LVAEKPQRKHIASRREPEIGISFRFALLALHRMGRQIACAKLAAPFAIAAASQRNSAPRCDIAKRGATAGAGWSLPTGAPLEIPHSIRGGTAMTLRLCENLSPWLVDWDQLIVMGGSIPPRDPDDDDEDEEGEEDDDREPPVVREPDEDQ
jgi:hypothetical protein